MAQLTLLPTMETFGLEKQEHQFAKPDAVLNRLPTSELAGLEESPIFSPELSPELHSSDDPERWEFQSLDNTSLSGLDYLSMPDLLLPEAVKQEEPTPKVQVCQIEQSAVTFASLDSQTVSPTLNPLGPRKTSSKPNIKLLFSLFDVLEPSHQQNASVAPSQQQYSISNAPSFSNHQYNQPTHVF